MSIHDKHKRPRRSKRNVYILFLNLLRLHKHSKNCPKLSKRKTVASKLHCIVIVTEFFKVHPSCHLDKKRIRNGV